MTDPVIPPAVPPMTTQQFIDLGKIPDFVRDVRSFSGDPTRLVDWIADVEAIFRTYRDNGATPAQLNILERTIRRKIEGEAADILNSNNIASNWNEIKNSLILYYKDQRDVKTLDYQLTSIRKSANENLNSYYSRVNELLSLIIAQVRTDNTMRLNASAHINYFREKALDAFIRGLDKPLSILLKSSNPATLSQAYNFCIEYHNLDIRSAPFRNELGGQPIPKPRALPDIPFKIQAQPKLLLPPPLPPRRQSTNPFQNNYQPLQRFPVNQFQNQPQSNPFRQNPFHTNPTNNPFRQNPFLNNPPNNPFRQNPSQNYAFSRPEPMEVDSSQQTRALNYGNRPVMNLKRPHPPSQQQHNPKRQAHPLENTYPNPEYYDSYYDYDGYGEQYWDESSYYDFEQPMYETGEPSTVDSQPEEVSPEPQEANFLEWLPSW